MERLKSRGGFIMDYDTPEMKKSTGESLRNDMEQVFAAFYKKEQLQNRVAELQERKKQPDLDKDGWKLKKILKKPPQWMLVAYGILVLLVGYLTATALWGDRRSWAYSNLGPILAGMLLITLYQAIIERRAIIAFIKKLLKKLKDIAGDKKEKGQNKNKSNRIIVVAVLITCLALELDADFFDMLQSWLFYVVAFVSVYRFMGWLEYKYVNVKKWEKEAEDHFAANEVALNREIVETNAALKNWNDSDEMAFACAAVPGKFQNAGDLAILLDLMEVNGFDTLSETAAAYEKQTFSDEKREQLKKIYWEQINQNAI